MHTKEFSNSGSSSSDSSKVDHSEHSKDSAEAYTIASSAIPSMKAIKVEALWLRVVIPSFR